MMTRTYSIRSFAEYPDPQKCSIQSEKNDAIVAKFIKDLFTSFNGV